MGFTFDMDLVERSSDDWLRFEFTVFAGGHCLDPLETLVPADFLQLTFQLLVGYYILHWMKKIIYIQ